MNQVVDDRVRRQVVEQLVQSGGVRTAGVGTHGNSGRNAFEGPGGRNVNLALVRAFRFMETHRIEARVEAFNAFNWFRWGTPINNLSDANFGRILSSLEPRIMQFALKYSF